MGLEMSTKPIGQEQTGSSGEVILCFLKGYSDVLRTSGIRYLLFRTEKTEQKQ